MAYIGNSPALDETVSSSQIVDLTVATADIAADAITGAKIADDAIDSEHYTNLSIDNAHVATGLDAVKLADGSVTNTELQYINSLSSNAQTQLTAKLPLAGGTLTGTVTVGANTDGHDVKFFGDTTGKYMLWDDSADKLLVSGIIETTDLVLHNERGHYTIVEEEDYLSIKNENTGKKYKFVLEEIDE